MALAAIKAIETKYAGHHFRSRLEARWAVFFDALKIPWEYEPEGFECPSGWYLPDFLLHCKTEELRSWPDERVYASDRVWFEVKPPHYGSSGRRGGPDIIDPRWRELSEATGIGLYVACGLPRVEEMECGGWHEGREWLTRQGPTYDTAEFCSSPDSGIIGLSFDGRGARLDGLDGKDYSADDPRILRAYQQAISARF